MGKVMMSIAGYALAAGMVLGAQSPANPEEQTAPVAQQAPETPKRGAFRRTTFLYTRPIGVFSKLKGGAVAAAPRELFGSRKAARMQRLSQQQARIEQGFSNRFASQADVAPLSARRTQDSFAPAETPKPRAQRQAQPGEFRPTIYGLE